MDNNSMDSMLDIYLFEANELLEQLDEILINSEKQGAFDTDSINEIFRIMHTVKGSSAMMQFNSLMTVAHKTEDMFYFVREHNGVDEKYISSLFDLMFKVSDFLKAEIEKVESNNPLTEDIDKLVKEILDFLATISSGKDLKKDNKPVVATPVAEAQPQKEEA
ncbi:MAG: Hpt domain-containing protein, partial [Oscillospiraceae bacterium]